MSKNTVSKRGATYPAVTLRQAVELAQKIAMSKLGNGPYTRQVIAHALGYSEASGLIAAKMAACVHFGIMTNNGNGYRFSSLGKRLVNPNDINRGRTLGEAVNNPLLYSRLINDFGGDNFPYDLEELLARKYNINPTVAPKVARIFRSSLEYAGLLNQGKICRSNSHSNESMAVTKLDKAAVDNHSLTTYHKQAFAQSDRDPKLTDSKNDVIKITLPETGIIILFPKKYAYDLGIGTFSNEITALRDKALKEKGGNM